MKFPRGPKARETVEPNIAKDLRKAVLRDTERLERFAEYAALTAASARLAQSPQLNREERRTHEQRFKAHTAKIAKMRAKLPQLVDGLRKLAGIGLLHGLVTQAEHDAAMRAIESVKDV